jgi:LAS superfamily LD-carboxypeptidase LdcB
MVDINITAKDIAKSMQLRYVYSGYKGYSRQKKGNHFVYLDTEERK